MPTMLDRGPYGQTDVMSDPNHLRDLLSSPHKRIRDQAELALKQLYQQQDFGQREQDRGETRAQRFQISDLNRGAREDSHAETLAAMTADRESKRESLQFAHDTQRAQALQLAMSDPNLKPEEKAAAKSEFMKLLNVPVTSTTTTGTKGAYGPGGAPATGGKPGDVPASALAVKPPPEVFTPPTKAFTSAAIPEEPNASPPSFHASRYSNDLSGPQLGRAKANLDRGDAEDARVNQLLYKRDIGGANFAKVYGTSDPVLMHPDMSPAANIPDIYGGQPTIPKNAGVGYYDAKGGFIGPAYDESGVKLPVPHGTVGMVGTANLGLHYDPSSGNVLNPTAAQGHAIAGPQPIQNPTAAFTQPTVPPTAAAPTLPGQPALPTNSPVPSTVPPPGPDKLALFDIQKLPQFQYPSPLVNPGVTPPPRPLPSPGYY